MARISKLNAFAWRQGWDLYLKGGATVFQLVYKFDDSDLRDYSEIIFMAMGGTNDLAQMSNQTRSNKVATLADIVTFCERVVKRCK